MQTVLAKRIAATETLRGGRLIAERISIFVVVVAPLAGLLCAALWIGAYGVSAADLGIFVAFYLFTGMGITVGYHRLFTHRSFHTSQWLEALFAIAGAMAGQGPVIRWAADHRRHHAHADGIGDAHSPQRSGSVAGRLFYAHVGWLFGAERSVAKRYVPDLLKNRAVIIVDRLYFLWMILSLVAPALLGLVLSGSWRGALSALIIGGLARMCLVNQVTWSINSICHYIGSRSYQTRDFSRNNGWLAVVSLGEAWHNNHHAFPRAARFGHTRWQADIGGLVIGLLEELGLVWQVRQAIRDKPQLVNAGSRYRLRTGCRKPLAETIELPARLRRIENESKCNSEVAACG